MNAEQMFKELGYKKEEDDFYIRYRSQEEIAFNFVKVGNTVTIPSGKIYKDEIKPFIQQCKEIGWLDD